ncbi:MAG: glycosyltransferase [Proteobacteria bacterium]|nr:glycosyltransferase [Pseudomonadota bacterium]
MALKRVLIVIGSLRSGGTERQASLTANALCEQGIDVTVLVFDNTQGAAYELHPRVKLVAASGGVSGVCLTLVRLVRAQRNVDVVMSYLDLANALCALVSTRSSRLVWNLRSSSVSPGLINRMAFNLSRWQSRRRVADIVLANAHSVLNFYAAQGFDLGRGEVLPNAIDTNVFKPDPTAGDRLREHLGVQKGVPLVGFFARYQPEKRHDLILQAVSRWCADIHLVMIGRGVDTGNNELCSQISKVGLVDRVHLLGEQKDMGFYHAAVDLQVCASDFEGLPNVLLEAMASGVPCVGTDVGGISELLMDCGVLVPPDQPDSLGQAIHNLLTDSDRVMDLVMHAHTRIKQRYTKDQVTGQLVFRLSCLTK